MIRKLVTRQYTRQSLQVVLKRTFMPGSEKNRLFQGFGRTWREGVRGEEMVENGQEIGHQAI